MSIIDLTSAALRAEGPDYSKFDFQKGNNKARILIPGVNPDGSMAEQPRIAQAFVHSLYRSEAMMVANDKGRVNPEWEGNTYAGTFHCTGDFNTVAANPTYGDPANCAACKSLHDGSPRVAGAPKKQWAMNVLRYQTKPNDFEVIGDSVIVELWKHGNDRNIAPIATALKETGKSINHLDFLIETDGSMYKKLQIQMMFPAAYGREGKDQLKASVVESMKRLYDDNTLLAALGEKVSKEALASNVAAAIAQASAGLGSPGGAEAAAAANPFAAVAATEPTTTMTTPAEKTSAEDLAKVDVASIDSLL